MTNLLTYNPQDERLQSLFAGLLQGGPALMAAGMAQQNPGARAQLLMGAGQGFGQGQQGYARNSQQNMLAQAQIAKVKQEQEQLQRWNAMFGLPGSGGAPGTPQTPGASPDPGALQVAMSGNPMPGPTQAAAGKLDMQAQGPMGVIPANMRQMIGAMGPEKGGPMVAALMAKNLETGTWKDEERLDESGRKLRGQYNKLTGEFKPLATANQGTWKAEDRNRIPGQVNSFTGEWKPIDPTLSKVSVNPSMNLPPQEDEEQKIVGRKFGEMYTGMQSAALDAPSRLAKMDKLEGLLSRTYTGLGGDQVQQANRALKAAGDAMGLDTTGITEKVGAAEASQALANEMALEFRNPQGGAGMPGAMSDQDREFLKNMVGANLSTTPEGRKQIIDARRKLIEREKDIAKMAREYRKKNKRLDEGFFDEMQAFSDKNPLFEKPKGSGTGTWSITPVP